MLTAKLSGRVARQPGVLAVVAFVTVAVGGIFAVKVAAPWIAETGGLRGKDRAAEIASARTAVLAILAGAVAVVGAIYTALTFALNREGVALNREGQVTERFSRAIDQLGEAKSLDMRLGGIYALERIARESPSDHGPIMEILAAYVREYRTREDTLRAGAALAATETGAPDAPGAGDDVDPSSAPRQPRTDVQAAVTVLAIRREPDYDPPWPWRVDLRRARLRGVELDNAHLNRVRLSGADLDEAHLRFATLEDADLNAAHLEGAKLSHANLERAEMRDAYLRGADLQNATLKDADLFAADMRGADLENTNLESAVLTDAQLQGADLRGARLAGATLLRAHAERARLGTRPTTLPNSKVTVIYESGADLSGAFLTEAHLQGADLSTATLRGADLKGVHLEGADLSRAQLDDTDLRGAFLEGTNLTGASLRNSSLQGAHFDGATILDALSYDLRTDWPDGFKPSPPPSR